MQEGDDKYDYYLNFIKAVANVSYFTMDNFTEYENDTNLNDVDMLDLALKVWW